jgi:hypothetical protein
LANANGQNLAPTLSPVQVPASGALAQRPRFVPVLAQAVIASPTNQVTSQLNNSEPIRLENQIEVPSQVVTETQIAQDIQTQTSLMSESEAEFATQDFAANERLEPQNAVQALETVDEASSLPETRTERQMPEPKAPASLEPELSISAEISSAKTPSVSAVSQNAAPTDAQRPTTPEVPRVATREPQTLNPTQDAVVLANSEARAIPVAAESTSSHEFSARQNTIENQTLPSETPQTMPEQVANPQTITTEVSPFENPQRATPTNLDPENKIMDTNDQIGVQTFQAVPQSQEAQKSQEAQIENKISASRDSDQAVRQPSRLEQTLAALRQFDSSKSTPPEPNTSIQVGQSQTREVSESQTRETMPAVPQNLVANTTQIDRTGIQKTEIPSQQILESVEIMPSESNVLEALKLPQDQAETASAKTILETQTVTRASLESQPEIALSPVGAESEAQTITSQPRVNLPQATIQPATRVGTLQTNSIEPAQTQNQAQPMSSEISSDQTTERETLQNSSHPETTNTAQVQTEKPPLSPEAQRQADERAVYQRSVELRAARAKRALEAKEELMRDPTLELETALETVPVPIEARPVEVTEQRAAQVLAQTTETPSSESLNELQTVQAETQTVQQIETREENQLEIQSELQPQARTDVQSENPPQTSLEDQPQAGGEIQFETREESQFQTSLGDQIQTLREHQLEAQGENQVGVQIKNQSAEVQSETRSASQSQAENLSQTETTNLLVSSENAKPSEGVAVSSSNPVETAENLNETIALGSNPQATPDMNLQASSSDQPSRISEIPASYQQAKSDGVSVYNPQRRIQRTLINPNPKPKQEPNEAEKMFAAMPEIDVAALFAKLRQQVSGEETTTPTQNPQTTQENPTLGSSRITPQQSNLIPESNAALNPEISSAQNPNAQASNTFVSRREIAEDSSSEVWDQDGTIKDTTKRVLEGSTSSGTPLEAATLEADTFNDSNQAASRAKMLESQTASVNVSAQRNMDAQGNKIHVFDPPNRRILPPKPKVEAPKTEAEKLFEAMEQTETANEMFQRLKRTLEQANANQTEPTNTNQQANSSLEAMQTSSLLGSNERLQPNLPNLSEPALNQTTTSGKPAFTGNAPVQLGQTARRFLKASVGIDPNDVNIYQDPQSNRLTNAARADALALGDTILLSNQQALESPETLGLIAHELTHVARNRQTRFVPAVARNNPSLQSNAVAGNEEGLALGVEALARQAWSEVQNANFEAQHNLGINSSNTSNQTSNQSSSLVENESRFGSLPAPSQWPEWFIKDGTPPQAPLTAQASPNLGSIPTNSALPPVGAMSQMGLQAAAQGRDVPTPPPAAGPLPPSNSPKSEPNAKSAAPDLDAMARQVYAILKRRLANERYRS